MYGSWTENVVLWRNLYFHEKLITSKMPDRNELRHDYELSYKSHERKKEPYIPFKTKTQQKIIENKRQNGFES